jgi:integrase/recombinase XerC
VRAFLAARRSDGISSRSLMRMLAGSRSFARFLERGGKATVAALFMIRTPKPGKTLPRPLAVAAAKRMTETEPRAGEEREPGARP